MPQTAPTIDPEAMRANAGRASDLLKALANDKRLMILCLLVEGERSVGELNARLDLSQPALSQHLKVLRDEGWSIPAATRRASSTRWRPARPSASCRPCTTSTAANGRCAMPDMDGALQVQPFFHAATGTWTHVVSRRGDAVVIDSVLDYDAASGALDDSSIAQVLAHVRERGLRVQRVLETHAHADHLSAAQLVRAQTDAPVGIGAGIASVQAHFAKVFGIEPGELAHAFDATFTDGECIDAGGLRFEVMATPGHTSDSLSYVIDGNVFVGDTLFAPDVGTARCDFPGGSIDALYASIQRLYALPDDTVLWLCHDYPPDGRQPRASVNVGEQKRDNRMLAGDTTLEDFRARRSARDATLPAPKLLYPSLQVNIRGGRLPPADANGIRYLRTPLGNADLPGIA